MLFIEGYKQDCEREKELAAWQTSLMLSCMSGKSITPEELLDRR